MDALCQEISLNGRRFAKQEPIETIYFGGGTPSLLAPNDVAQILESIATNFDTTSVEEVTFELNPEDAQLDYLKQLRELGVNRVSVGVQSFADPDLQFMNRSHHRQQSMACIESIKEAGFSNWSLDLIFGVPGQTPKQWQAQLAQATQLDVPHVSTYGLTLEENTPFYKQVERGMVVPASEQIMATCYEKTMDFMEEQGYLHYEISSFARPGYASKHNQCYWNHTNYLGFGPSAHSFWWGQEAIRWANVRNIKAYINALNESSDPVENQEVLDAQTLVNEYILLKMRTQTGPDLATLMDRYGIDLMKQKYIEIHELEAKGLVRISDKNISLTKKGKPICDAITRQLIV